MESRSHWSILPPSLKRRRSSSSSPPPLVSTRYRLQGGTETLAGMYAQEEEDIQEQLRAYFRPNRFCRAEDNPHLARTPVPDYPDDDRHTKRRRLDTERRSAAAWSEALWAWTERFAGTAGKVLDFCWTMAFQGLSAGNGKAYNLDQSPLHIAKNKTRVEQSNQAEMARNKLKKLNGQSAVPECWTLIEKLSLGGINPEVEEEGEEEEIC
ncbi:hypothetical protein LTS13_009049 [Exophiala xenobiotica]|nr:hypothetical protein LTS13_009049 [Exophiala xenobiotica]KAK5399146.1 hypothetical protein LTR79_004144 [Exophiala xenobiotica]KAK5487281.1 hypothetical protein LTR26_005315 [Exophiala xenobiotica]KAK5520976.1 hypothetical protein LTR21_002668 [Exophiala xenobiotica]